MQLRTSKRVDASLCLLLALAAGCGRSLPATGSVSGRVTLDGKPLADAGVMFTPSSGGRPASGTTDEKGEYRLTTFAPADGALVGPHAVTVVKQDFSNRPTTPSGLPGGEGLRSGGGRWIVPEHYSQPETSKLSAEVAAGENRFDFDLVSKH